MYVFYEHKYIITDFLRNPCNETREKLLIKISKKSFQKKTYKREKGDLG